MQVEVVKERLAPGVQNGDHAELSVEPPLRIRCKCLEGIIDTAKEDGEHHGIVAQNERVEQVRDGEDEVKIAGRHEFRPAGLEPHRSGKSHGAG